MGDPLHIRLYRLLPVKHKPPIPAHVPFSKWVQKKREGRRRTAEIRPRNTGRALISITVAEMDKERKTNSGSWSDQPRTDAHLEKRGTCPVSVPPS